MTPLSVDTSSPLVSIIIRSMGRPTLRQAMDSVAGQHYPCLELVVVNAKGKDHPPLSDHYGHVPLRFCDDGQPLRRSHAANQGMAQAQGHYLLFLDDDDWLLPEHISALVAALQRQPHLRVVYAGVECVREEADGHRHVVLVYNQPFDAIRLLYENYIPIHAVLFERQLFVEGCQFDDALDVYEDWDFWLQLRAFGPFCHVDQVSAVYRLNTAENLGGTAHQGLQFSAWDVLIRKWRHRWSDYELRTICSQAKFQRQELHLSEQERQQTEYYRRQAEQYRQQAEQERQQIEQYRRQAEQYHQQTERTRAECESLITDLKQAQQATLDEQQARQAIRALLEQEQVQHEETLAVFQQRLEALAERLARQQCDLDATTAGLAAIESSTIWRVSYPYRWLMIRLRAFLRRQEEQETATLIPQAPPNIPCSPNRQPIDVIIPVYRGLVETRACLDSVLASVSAEWGEIIVIDDASPEPALVAWLEQWAKQHPQITVLHNTQNLGFVQTCNRGMALHPERDVVLLNSDTEVANDWLARLQACAYRDRRIGTVTPFSNNATICSYPRFCADNTLPDGLSIAELDALFNRCNQGALTDLPTAIGFCMYIRRDCLSEVGVFDEQHFGKGYGEENDFSMRAKVLGWRHVLCADVFVYHAGSVSFADHQNHQKRQAMAVLNRLHPDYEPMVHRYIAQDPARPFRLRVDLARIAHSRLPVVLFVTHDRGGGTRRHVEELAALFTDQLQFLLLRPGGNGQHLLSWQHSGEALQLIFDLPSDIDPLLACLQALAVQRLHFHHTLGLHPLLLELPERLGVPYDFTIHDYYACCPQISLTHYQNRYCGEPDAAGCNRCLAVLPAPGGGDIQHWRQRHQPFVIQAARVLAPSRDAARRFTRYFPNAHIRWAPHPDLDGHACPAPQPAPLSPDAPLRIVVLGALSPIKGADILEQCASDACMRGLPLTFQLLGYAYRDLRCPPGDFLRVHGAYDDADLPALLAQAQPHLIWFPALWPETYSYTLSACLLLGLPVVVPDLGAFPERVAGRAWSWVRPWEQSARAWNDFLIEIRDQCFLMGSPPPPPVHRMADSDRFFDYHRDYYIANDAATPMLDESTIDAVMGVTATTFAYPRLSSTARRQALVKLGLLNIAVHLRQAPMLRWAVRRIPLGWQTRVKTWLRGTLP
ncbi:MAG: glycosyltransferase [Gammaproteobacteria bacterium]|nr:glycosyltransferase [Gammaproteobacteria bacterium]